MNPIASAPRPLRFALYRHLENRGNDTVFKRAPDYEPYAEAVVLEIGKKRKCLSVIDPGIVAQKVPEIESLVFKHKHCSRKLTINDTSAFGIFARAQCGLFPFFWKYIFHNEEQTTSDTAALTNNTTLVFQVWDLKNRQFMYRGETRGSGEASRGGGSPRTPVQANGAFKTPLTSWSGLLPLCNSCAKFTERWYNYIIEFMTHTHDAPLYA